MAGHRSHEEYYSGISGWLMSLQLTLIQGYQRLVLDVIAGLPHHMLGRRIKQSPFQLEDFCFDFSRYLNENNIRFQVEHVLMGDKWKAMLKALRRHVLRLEHDLARELDKKVDLGYKRERCPSLRVEVSHKISIAAAQISSIEIELHKNQRNLRA